MRPFSKRHPPTAILAIGRNYAAHAAEMKGAAPERPVVFMKNPGSVIGHLEPVVIPPICGEHGPQVDYEGELAVLVGREIRDASPDAALGAVSHYLIANDVSARWWQREGSGGQFVRGKSFDTFCPLSEPVAAARIADPQALSLTTRLNGETVQQASTAEMIFPVAALLAELSRGMSILPGTILLTGTPSGVGARTPPRFLRAGDVVEIEITGLGVLRNPVIDECD